MPISHWVLAAAILAAAAPASAEPAVRGAGGTLPAALYAAWGAAYARDGGGEVSYDATGTGAALAALAREPSGAPRARFAASDAPMTRAGDKQVAVAVGGILPVANLPGIDPGAVVVDGPALARLFSGRTRFWDDADLRRLNPHLPLPHTPVTVVHRSDASGTTDTFTTYLDKAGGGAWGAGRGPTVAWPAGHGAAGNDAVAAAVAATEGAVGYVSFESARDAALPYLDMTAGEGHVVQPSPAAFASAAAAGTWDGATQAADLTATADPAAWPITAPTYALVPDVPVGSDTPVGAFLRYVLVEGDPVTLDAGFVPVPERVRARALEILRSR